MSTYAVAPPGYGLSLKRLGSRQADVAAREIAETVVEILAECPGCNIVAAVREAVLRTGYRLEDVLGSINYGAGLELFLDDGIQEQLRALG